VDKGASPDGDRATHEQSPQAVSAVPVGIPSAVDIRWHPNPLLTTVALTERDREIMLLRIQLSELEEWLWEARESRLTPEKIDAIVDREGASEEALRQLKWATDELTRGVHCGDCTCVPMSCSKCIAEEWLGINTIKGAGKHGLYKIDAAFGPRGEQHTDIGGALANLEAYEPKADWKGWEAHAERWKAEAERALEWLRAYRDEHFPAQGMETAKPPKREAGSARKGDSPVGSADAPNPEQITPPTDKGEA
jgi:hypothetical protein